MNIDDRIEAALIRYLKAEHDIDALHANFGFTDFEKAYNTGCDTCGYGGDEEYMYFLIYYRSADRMNETSLEIKGDPLGFLPTILKYNEE